MTVPNYTQLTPLSFLSRSAAVFPNKVAIVHGDTEITYRDFVTAVEVRARALIESGIEPGDRVAYLMPNSPEGLIAQFAVPLAGAVLVAVNTRLSAREINDICDHSGAKLLVCDAEYASRVAGVRHSFETVKQIVVVTDSSEEHAPDPIELSMVDFVARGRASNARITWEIADENSIISINYTSGTTGRPKGVMYTHRSTYLSSLGGVIHSGHDASTVYLWTLPMFHCNGWSTGWAVAAAGGTQVCLREVRGEEIWRLIDKYRVTHLNGASTVINTILNSVAAHTLTYRLVVTTGGAPPSPTIISRMEGRGMEAIHVYGLTETYGPVAVCQKQPVWADLTAHERARRNARQGVAMIQSDQLRIVTTEPGTGDLVDVPADGSTMGEIVVRGNNVMKGYYRDTAATTKAFAGGWFHSGDLGVMHPDGYIELRDREKDIIVSGGENISTVEVEQALLSHEAVDEAAVVGVPDMKWGERPKAFVVLKDGFHASREDLRKHVTDRLARYKAPRDIDVVGNLPKTSTGKIQKFVLKDREWQSHGTRIQG